MMDPARSASDPAGRQLAASRSSFSTLACPDWSWGEIASNAAAYGYGGVEVRMIEGQTDLLAHVRNPAVGVLWDTHHPWRFHGEPIAETYQRLRPRIRHTHWKDSVLQEPGELSAEAAQAKARARSINRGHRTASYVPFGTGEFPAAETLKLLLEGGYEGWFSLEWEKAWHPQLADPEVVLPQFPAALRGLFT